MTVTVLVMALLLVVVKSGAELQWAPV